MPIISTEEYDVNPNELSLLNAAMLLQDLVEVDCNDAQEIFNIKVKAYHLLSDLNFVRESI